MPRALQRKDPSYEDGVWTSNPPNRCQELVEDGGATDLRDHGLSIHPPQTDTCSLYRGSPGSWYVVSLCESGNESISCVEWTPTVLYHTEAIAFVKDRILQRCAPPTHSTLPLRVCPPPSLPFCDYCIRTWQHSPVNLTCAGYRASGKQRWIPICIMWQSGCGLYHVDSGQ